MQQQQTQQWKNATTTNTTMKNATTSNTTIKKCNNDRHNNKKQVELMWVKH